MTTPKTKETKKSINEIEPGSLKDKLKKKVDLHNGLVERKNDLLDELNKVESTMQKNLGSIEVYQEIINESVVSDKTEK